jgi:hypothetical protein
MIIAMEFGTKKSITIIKKILIRLKDTNSITLLILGISDQKVVEKANWKTSVLRKFHSYYTLLQYLQIMTVQFFRSFHYCLQVWLTMNAKFNLWKLINSADYKANRIAIGDHKSKITCNNLSVLSKRASPKQWSKYDSHSPNPEEKLDVKNWETVSHSLQLSRWTGSEKTTHYYSTYKS